MEPQVILSRLLDSARKAGARAAEVLLVETRSLSLTWQAENLAPVGQRNNTQLLYSVYMKGGRHATSDLQASTLDLIAPRLEADLSATLERADKADDDPIAGPSDRFDLEERGLGLLDRRQPNLQLSDRRELIRDNVRACAEVSPDIALVRMDYHETLRRRTFASTRGVSAAEDSTSFSLYGVAAHRHSGRVLRDGIASRYFANIASIPIGIELGRRMEALHQEATLPGTPQPIFLSARAMAELLRALAPAFIAPTVRSGKSFVSRFLGKRIASRRLHVIDDPGLPGALHCRAFDDRGVPPVPVVIVREGTAAGLLYDTNAARIDNVRPTGHFIDGRLQPSNLVMRPGTRSRNAIGMDLGDYLVLDGFCEANPVSIETGMVTSPMDVLVYKDNTFMGTVREVPMNIAVRQLLSTIVEIAGDQTRFDDVDACSVVLDGLPFPPG